jgi:hypothetical protein
VWRRIRTRTRNAMMGWFSNTKRQRHGTMKWCRHLREKAQDERLSDFIKTLKSQDGILLEFDSGLWGCMVEYVTVGRNKEITVTFRDGTEIQA